jgi:methylmalonyl-CoA mutase N-terminal domain/subunit
MYRGRPWTIRQYAGYGSAEETNARFRYLLERGQTGLSVAFDLPTQLGYDSDDPLADGEVGRTGRRDRLARRHGGAARRHPARPRVDLDDDQRARGAPAAPVRARRRAQGVPGPELRGTVQNDVLKEYVARGNYIFPPRPSMRLATDLFAYCAGAPAVVQHDLDLRVPHPRGGRERGQELAFTLANGIAYCEAAIAAGLSPDAFGERVSFFFNAHNHFFQEVAKFRAARRLWAGNHARPLRRDEPARARAALPRPDGRLDADGAAAENNIVRVAIQALSAVSGGAQSLHTNSFDEALALPTERSARIALRTQQILAAEAGTTDTADPFGGSYFVEALTDELEQRASELIAAIDELGGAVAAIEQGFVQAEIEASAFRFQTEVESGARVVVGVNAFAEDESEAVELQQVDPEIERRQRERTARAACRARRRRGRRGARRGPPHSRLRREPLASDARGAARRLHGRRDLWRPPRALGYI